MCNYSVTVVSTDTDSEGFFSVLRVDLREVMLTDTKEDVELAGDIDEQMTSEQTSTGMSLPMPLNISQPVVKEWFTKKRANLRPLGTFFNTANFQVMYIS